MISVLSTVLKSSMIKAVEMLEWLSLINFPFHFVSNHPKKPSVISKVSLSRNEWLCESLRTKNVHLQNMPYDIFQW